jgi:uncharacterized protein YdiU (UPF0061 family)
MPDFGTPARTLAALRFDGSFVRELPADPSSEPRPRQVSSAAYSRVAATPVAAPKLVAYSREAAALLDLDAPDLTTPQAEDWAQVFSGNRPLPGMQPYAACYGGHQFGVWAGQLGDGRALTLGEVSNARGERWELQLKGAGPTPYSRTADGRAVLRSSIREFLCSEAMHHLGIPTTRALCLVQSGEPVLRDMLYDGHPSYEPGAIVCRLAPSFLRFGSYQLPNARRDSALLRALGAYTLEHFYPQFGPPEPASYGALFGEVCRRTAELIAHFMRVGFVHAVLNTDNMSILGLAIDYGPFGFLDQFALDYTPNLTDAEQRRYCYGNQPGVAHWNLLQLAHALLPLVETPEPLEAGLELYATTYEHARARCWADKLGLHVPSETEAAREDEALLAELLELLARLELDMTLFFRSLGELDPQGTPAAWAASLRATSYRADWQASDHEQLEAWLTRWHMRAAREPRPHAERREQMRRANPKYVLRNYLVQQAIDRAEQGDYAEVHALLELLRRPYDDQPGREAYTALRPDWAKRRPGCALLSCSS